MSARLELKKPKRVLARSPRIGAALAAAFFTSLILLPQAAEASHFQGETLDKIADVLTWIVIIIAPIVGIAVFLMIHILPEKVAEKRKHPQAKAIQCLCILSLVFGGLLWPLAWLWAYSKPALYKMAYGTDEADEEDHGSHKKSEGVNAVKGERG
jgi:CBS domain containing-hemolysin-like protein